MLRSGGSNRLPAALPRLVEPWGQPPRRASATTRRAETATNGEYGTRQHPMDFATWRRATAARLSDAKELLRVARSRSELVLPAPPIRGRFDMEWMEA